jgi:parallel beta-helix repeat protein
MNALRSTLAVLATPLLLASALLAPTPAAAETTVCTGLPTLPTTITVSGHYCVNKNFSQAFSAAAIIINAHNVVLDCNDHSINNTSGGVTGVYASNRSGVTVRNCNISNFGRGIAFFETADGASRNNVIVNNAVSKSRLVGIQVAGTSNLIADNRVTENLGGSTGGGYTYGILLSSFGDNGVGNVIRNNTITNMAPSIYARVIGIYMNDVDNNALIGNTISSLFPPMDLGVYGIIGSTTSIGNAAIGNTVLAATNDPPGGGGGISYGGANYDGILFNANPDTWNRNVCRDNTVGHWLTNITAETTEIGCVKDQNTEV